MSNWMSALAHHYEDTRERYPGEKLMIMFDIDGTIVDTRYMVLHGLKGYDQANGTDIFKDLEVSQIRVSESRVDALLDELGLEGHELEKVLDWWNESRWSLNVLLEAHRPYSGVMEVMRWFQLQPNVEVGINTGRPASVKSETMRCLNELGTEYKVRFTDELVHMNPGDWGEEVERSKVEGLHRFRAMGRRVFAFVDNEPANLLAVSRADLDRDVLLLHANTIFQSRVSRLPHRSVKGKVYDFTRLASEARLPRHIQFVWHGVNDKANLRQFLASDVQWGEVDARSSTQSGRLVTGIDRDGAVRALNFEDVLDRVVGSGKSIKVDVKEDDATVAAVIDAIKRREIADSRLWFNGRIETLGQPGFTRLREAFPDAVLQCPVDFAVPLTAAAPQKALDILSMISEWGVNRVSVKWGTVRGSKVLDRLHSWKFDVDIYNVPDLESFLQAVLLEPCSITSDFNFPSWQYYGRGSGEHGSVYEYSMRRIRQSA